MCAFFHILFLEEINLSGILLTQDGGWFIGDFIAKVAGFIMDAIFNFLDWVGIPNIGLVIIEN